MPWPAWSAPRRLLPSESLRLRCAPRLSQPASSSSSHVPAEAHARALSGLSLLFHCTVLLFDCCFAHGCLAARLDFHGSAPAAGGAAQSDSALALLFLLCLFVAVLVSGERLCITLCRDNTRSPATLLLVRLGGEGGVITPSCRIFSWQVDTVSSCPTTALSLAAVCASCCCVDAICLDLFCFCLAPQCSLFCLLSSMSFQCLVPPPPHLVSAQGSVCGTTLSVCAQYRFSWRVLFPVSLTCARQIAATGLSSCQTMETRVRAVGSRYECLLSNLL